MQKKGFNVTYLDVNKEGYISLDDLKEHISDNTLLVSIMAVNNEIGVIQPIKKIGAICKEYGAYFHSDAAQAFGKIPIDVNEMNIDLLSISGHKIYGPKGVGALYIRRRPRVRMLPLIHGGGQEFGLRAGTLPTPLIVGLGEAAKIAKNKMQSDMARINELTNYFLDAIIKEGAILNGGANRVAGNINVSFPKIKGSNLILALKKIAVSSGAACSSSSSEPSYVLRAIGLDDKMIESSIRIGMGRFTTKEEVDFAIEEITSNVRRLYAAS